MTRHVCAGIVVLSQADVTKITRKIRQIPSRQHAMHAPAGQWKDAETASFQRRAPFAINPLVAACRKPGLMPVHSSKGPQDLLQDAVHPLKFSGFGASGAGLTGPDPSDRPCVRGSAEGVRRRDVLSGCLSDQRAGADRTLGSRGALGSGQGF